MDTTFQPFLAVSGPGSMAESISESPPPVADTDEHVPTSPCEAPPKGDNCKLDSLDLLFRRALVYADFMKSRTNEPCDNDTTPGGRPCDPRQPELVIGAVMCDYQVLPFYLSVPVRWDMACTSLRCSALGA
jgi:hypothetical protein